MRAVKNIVSTKTTAFAKTRSLTLLGIVIAFLALPGVARARTAFFLNGGGWGHGVGMSQWGAEGFARHGYDYRQILAHYYPHTQLAVGGEPDVRVLLVHARRSVRVSSALPYLVVDATGKKLHLKKPLRVTGRLKLPLRFEAGAAPLTLNGDGYRGDLIVNPGLQVINELPLERYLRGVVPWEVPKGWHDATYEAQAIAARSYALATLNPSAPFDVYDDTRSQMYGGIRAEEPWTNLAVGATAGKVLTYGSSVITAYYFSTSGGRTTAVQDEWPTLPPVPYLVSVADPYDSISPKHRWATRELSPAWLGAKLGLRGVRDIAVADNASQHAATVRVLAAGGWESLSAETVRQKLHLRSTDFRFGAVSFEPPPHRHLLGSRVTVRGTAHGVSGLQLERQVGSSWRTVAYVHPIDGSFSVSLRRVSPLRLRLVADGLPMPVVSVAPAR
ncbi:MAG TPA: SpoIID/LytB domain-containing protein [Gaiellaceae bacterium]|nr:SpoIID/LytB domain-containing protein [Gaiellaceae bacterium]